MTGTNKNQKPRSEGKNESDTKKPRPLNPKLVYTVEKRGTVRKPRGKTH